MSNLPRRREGLGTRAFRALLPFVALGSSLVSALIFGVTPYDGVSVLVALVVLLGVGSACGIIPALRASRVDPLVALRYE
jgi:ABC-type antimicrobial peptide transport system permease subunit